MAATPGLMNPVKVSRPIAASSILGGRKAGAMAKNINDLVRVVRIPKNLEQQVLAARETPEYQHIQSSLANLAQRLLRIAGRMDHPEAFRSLLPVLMKELHAGIPEGVLAPPRGKPGRPQAEQTKAIFNMWKKLGFPPIADLARNFYGTKFHNADRADKKRMADRCNKAVDRYVRRNPGANTSRD